VSTPLRHDALTPPLAPTPAAVPGAALGGSRIEPVVLIVALGAVLACSSGDRVVLPVLKTTLATELRLTNSAYSTLFMLFMGTYTFAYLWVGPVIARLGVKRVLLGAVALMSVSMLVCGAARVVTQLGAGLLILGSAQACVMPAVTVAIVHTVAASRQAFVYAVVNAIQSSATILAPSVIAGITLHLGWRWSFFVPALAGGLVALAWWKIASRAGPTLQHTAPAPHARGSTWRQLLARPLVVTLMVARAISDPFWFFFQFWHLSFLREQRGLGLADIARLAWIPPLAAVLAVFVFSTFSDRLVRRGWRTDHARLVPIFCATAASVALFWLPLTQSVGAAVLLCALASMMCAVWLSLSNLLMGALVPAHLLAPALGWMSAIGGASALVLTGLSGVAIDHLGYGPPLWIGAALHPIAAALLAWKLRTSVIARRAVGPLIRSGASRS
jgi:ACS family hexuronate transporter-like MFS transporter